MSPQNRTAKEIAAVRRALAAGNIPPEMAEKRIADLETKGPVFVARWELLNGKERTKSFSGKGAEKKAAAHEAEQRGKVRRREADDPQSLRVTVAAVLEFYLEKKLAGRAGQRIAAGHRDHILAIWGDRLSLERLDRDPDTLIDNLKDKLEEVVGEKTAWNVKVTAQAAVNYYLRKKRIRLINPFLGADWPRPESRREQAPTFEQYQAWLEESRKEKYPAWLPYFLTLGWEQALRIGEYMTWHWEGVTLDPTGDDLPWVQTVVLKQGKEKPVVRELPLTLEAAEALRAWPARNKERGLVLPLKRSMVARYVRRVMDACGDTDLEFHDFRRAWKRRHLHLPAPLRADALGHGEEMDAHYLVLKRKELEAVVRASYSAPGHFRDMNPGSGVFE